MVYLQTSIDASAFAAADMARSLLLTVSNTIGQMAVLYALNCGVSRIYFGGFFIRGNPVTMRTITFAVNYFSKVTTTNTGASKTQPFRAI